MPHSWLNPCRYQCPAHRVSRAVELRWTGLEIRLFSEHKVCVTRCLTYSLDRNSNQVRFCWEESLPSCTQALCFALGREKASDTAKNTRAELLGQLKLLFSGWGRNIFRFAEEVHEMPLFLAILL